LRILEVSNLSKSFGGVKAVSSVNFTLGKGEILGIIGPNGAGKTTIFNLISGALKPTSGTILLKGEPITGKRPSAICCMGLARTFQICRPFQRLSVHQNVLAGAFRTAPQMKRASTKADEILELTGLYPKRDRLGKDLNILDRKRLELARALATDPEILLLDEVMAGLNARELQDVLLLVQKIRAQEVTIILIEHIMRVVMSTCTRILGLNFGEIIAEGPPGDVAKDPALIKAYLGERRESVIH
jgi:branched-chain amino acid transport system ATP-binding protein